MGTRALTVAAAAYPLEPLDFAGWQAKIAAWVAEAAGQGADLLVFPEYAGMEPIAAAAPGPEGWLGTAADAAPRIAEHMAALAARHGVHILAGSGPERDAAGRFVNRARLVAPDGSAFHQDKQILTPWERGATRLVDGDPLAVFDTALGRIGVLICYDSEFPLLARALECDLLLVPSCTEKPHGRSRVRLAARARALEGQIPVVWSATMGAVENCVFIEENTGGAGVYLPPDTGFPEDGILAERVDQGPGWVVAPLDLGQIAEARRAAAVSIRGDWDRQAARLALRRNQP